MPTLYVTGLFCIVGWFSYRFFSRPSHDREWIGSHKRLPYVDKGEDGSLVVHNIRKARYRGEFEHDVAYVDERFDTQKILRVWFVIEPYDIGQAHTFLSFEFEGGRFLSVSTEVRKTASKSFKAWKVALFNYEIFYVLADEQDVLYLRTNIRKDRVMLYPLRLSQREAISVFESVVDGVNGLQKNPTFYRVFTRNCTSVPMKHIRFGTKKIPRFDIGYVVTSLADRILYKSGLIDTDVPLSKIRERYCVTDRARSFSCDEDFSKKIRQ